MDYKEKGTKRIEVLEVSRCSVSTLRTDGLFFAGGFLAGCELTRLWMRGRVDVLGLVSLSGPRSSTSSPYWERLEFLFVV